MVISKMILSLIFGGLLWVLMDLYKKLILKPKRLRLKLEKQGIKGPSPSFLHGNIPEMIHLRQPPQELHAAGGLHVVSHDWATKVFPHLHLWRSQFGKTFMYSTGNIHFLSTIDLELVKEVSLYTSLDLGKPSYLSKDIGPLLGQGIISSSGAYWANQRKIIAPQLYPDKVKDLVTLMANATRSILQLWETKIEDGAGYADIKVDDDLRSLSADIISRACFGSNYTEGEMIFSKLRTLQNILPKASIGVLGSRYLPSKTNREIWKLEKDINSRILKVVKSCGEATNERNLLQTIIEAAKKHEAGNDKWININPNKFIIDNCKSLYFAGYETTATSASWCLMLLAANPEWQARVRSEVVDVSGDKIPDMAMLQSMKTLTMVIQEALRLYPPGVFVVRETLEDINFKEIRIPRGINVQIPIPLLHQQPELWGPDVYEFNPERFKNGTKNACKFPQAYMPFGTGPRICAGQHFAMAELKVILALVLSRFSFSLSPTYQHSPAFGLTIEPRNGIYLHVSKV